MSKKGVTMIFYEKNNVTINKFGTIMHYKILIVLKLFEILGP